MASSSRLLMNVSLVAVIAVLFAGCTLFPGKSKDTDLQYTVDEVTGDDETFTEVSEDDSLQTIESELNATVIEDEDFTDLEAELDAETDLMVY